MYRLLHPLGNGICVLLNQVEDHIKTAGLSALAKLKQDMVSFKPHSSS
jgi:hypothetical protein